VETRDLTKIESDVVRVGMPLVHGTNLYPMVKPQGTEIRGIKTAQKDGVEVSSITFTNLDCTYVETVRHISSDGPLPLEVFAKRPARDLYRAVVVHVDVEEGGEITLSDLEKSLREVRKCDALLVDANSYTDKWLTRSRGVIDVREYNLGSPYFSTEAMRGIISQGVAILGGNFPSFSNPKTKEGFGVDMIAEFYKTKENMILAPLLNLKKVHDLVVALQVNPIEIPGWCGLPCSPVVYQGDLKRLFLEYLERALHPQESREL